MLYRKISCFVIFYKMFMYYIWERLDYILDLVIMVNNKCKFGNIRKYDFEKNINFFFWITY